VGGGGGVWVMMVAEARVFLAGGGVLFERRHSVGEVGFLEEENFF